jgi:hypothetical protein
VAASHQQSRYIIIVVVVVLVLVVVTVFSSSSSSFSGQTKGRFPVMGRVPQGFGGRPNEGSNDGGSGGVRWWWWWWLFLVSSGIVISIIIIISIVVIVGAVMMEWKISGSIRRRGRCRMVFEKNLNQSNDSTVTILLLVVFYCGFLWWRLMVMMMMMMMMHFFNTGITEHKKFVACDFILVKNPSDLLEHRLRLGCVFVSVTTLVMHSPFSL